MFQPLRPGYLVRFQKPGKKTNLTARWRRVCHSLLTTSDSLSLITMTSGSEDSPVRSMTSSPVEKQNVRIKIRDCRGIKRAASVEQAEVGFTVSWVSFFQAPVQHFTQALPPAVHREHYQPCPLKGQCKRKSS